MNDPRCARTPPRFGGPARGRLRSALPPRPPRPADPWDGVLYVDKPAGPTSHDVVEAVRRGFGFGKVGHGGTLDPLATGLLVLLIGRGTKFSTSIIGMDKTYEGTLRLGVTTDSYDAAGAVVREADPGAVTPEALAAEMKKLTGDLLQVPPMVSAVKKDGIPLYKSARQGLEVARDARLIHVYEFSLMDFQPPLADFRVRCTKGTYVRKLCHDVGEALGCGGHLAFLRRTAIGRARIEDSIPLEDLLGMDRDEAIRRIIPLKTLTLPQ